MKLFRLITLVLTGIVSPSLVQASWEILDLPTDRGFGAIWAIDEQTILVSGHQGLWKSFDGVNWELDTIWVQPPFIYFVDDTLGFLKGSILTIDGGRTWIKADTVNGNVGPIFFPKGQSFIGYGLGYDYASKTTDGGWHWNQLPPLPDVYPGFDETISPGDICFPDGLDTGYLTAACIKHLPEGEIEYHSSYFKTTDAGQTWVLNEEGLWNDDFGVGYIDFPQNASVGYMSGGGRVYKTTDGGATWDTVLVDTNMSMNDMSFPETDQVGYIIGSNKAYKTTDGGETWRKLEFGQDTILRNCHFVDDSLGFITGIHNIEAYLMPYDPGFVLKTTDGLLGIAEEDWVKTEPKLVELSAPAIFRDELIVSYSSRAKGRLKASLFDAAGREIETLGWISVYSSGSLHFSGAELASGVYFVRVEFSSARGNQIKTIRAVKVR